jgi:hypothetical protein
MRNIGDSNLRCKANFPRATLRSVALSLMLSLTGTAITQPDSRREQIVKTFLSRLDKQDWRGIYRMASPAEKRWMRLTEKQFVQLNQALAEGFPKNLNAKFYEMRKVKDGWYALLYRNDATPLLAPDFDKEVRPSVSGVDLLLVKGRWHPQISSLPFDLLAHRQEPRKQRHQRLLRAMRKAGIRSLTLTDPVDPPRKLTISELQLVIQGRLNLRQALRKH